MKVITQWTNLNWGRKWSIGFLEAMKSNVGECELSQHCVWRPHSIMGYLSDGINHSATVMHNAVKQNFTVKNIPTRWYLMTAVVWWGCLFIKCQSPSQWEGGKRVKSKQNMTLTMRWELMLMLVSAMDWVVIYGRWWAFESKWLPAQGHILIC